MNSTEAQQLIDQAHLDRDFIFRLLADPQAAARELGLSISAHDAAELERYAASMRRCAEGDDHVYPSPIFAGDPDGTKKPEKPKPPKEPKRPKVR